jgi:primosomal protein N' (replication factor Y)
VAGLGRLERERARHLRGSATEAERRLWDLLPDRRLAGRKFRRQHPIPPWTADFACVEAHLVVEADGGQHGDERDLARDQALAAQGWRVLRFWNSQILEEPDSVATVISEALLTAAPPPRPLYLDLGAAAW